MKEFFLDILPAILLVIVLFIVLNDFRNNKNLKRNKRYSKESGDINNKARKRVDYMSIGMCFGIAISIFFYKKIWINFSYLWNSLWNVRGKACGSDS